MHSCGAASNVAHRLGDLVRRALAGAVGERGGRDRSSVPSSPSLASSTVAAAVAGDRGRRPPACRRRCRSRTPRRGTGRGRAPPTTATTPIDDPPGELAALLLLGLLLVLELAVRPLPLTLLGSHERRRLPAAGADSSVDDEAGARTGREARPVVGLDREPQPAEVGEVLVDGAACGGARRAARRRGRRRSAPRRRGDGAAMSSSAGSTRSSRSASGSKPSGRRPAAR